MKTENFNKGNCLQCEYLVCPANNEVCLRKKCPMYSYSGCKCCKISNGEDCPWFKPRISKLDF